MMIGTLTFLIVKLRNIRFPYVIAAIAACLDADAVVRVAETDVIHGNILRATGNFAADGEAMPMQKYTVFDHDIPTVGSTSAKLYGFTRQAGAAQRGDAVRKSSSLS